MIKQLATLFKENNHTLFEVGGSVRDSILGRKPSDLDFCTDALPDETIKLARRFGDVYTIGGEYGTIGLHTKEGLFEITTYRKEVYPQNSRKPKVIFGDSLVEDLKRRDFTINTLCRDPLNPNEIIDYFGGLNDLNNKIIRCVGSNSELFRDDPLRMIRAIRFACQLDFELDIEITDPKRLSIISNERIRDELVKILLTDRCVWGVRQLCDYGLMTYIIPEIIDMQNITQNKFHFKPVYEHSLLVLEKGAKLHNDIVFRLACLLHDIGKPKTKSEDIEGVHFYQHQCVGASMAEIILKRLRFDNDIVDKVCHLIRLHMMPVMLQRDYESGTLKKKTIIRMIRNAGEDNIYQLLDLVCCDLKSSASPRMDYLNDLKLMVDKCISETPPSQLVSPLSGLEVMQILNLPPGRMVGKLKNYLTECVIDGIIDKDDKEGAVKLLKEKCKNNQATK